MSLSDPLVNSFLLVLLGLCLTIFLLSRHFEPFVEASEPPLVRQRVPVIGNILGMYLYGPGYYQRTR